MLAPRERHLRYDQLGVYKYLMRVPLGERVLLATVARLTAER